jgi:Spy/CpxP family protein refolding chaperone
MPGPRGALPPSLAGLDLTPDQRSRVSAILERSRPRTDSLLRQTWPQVRALMDSVQLQIREVLTPAQREQFDAINRRILRFDRDVPRPPIGPPPR